MSFLYPYERGGREREQYTKQKNLILFWFFELKKTGRRTIWRVGRKRWRSVETKNYFFHFERVGFRPKVWGKGGAVEEDGST